MAAVLAVLAPPGFAQESFAPFLDRFIADETFRLSRVRLPLAATMGGEEPKREAWSIDQVRKNLEPPRAKARLINDGLEQKLTRYSATSMKLFQFRPEADSHLIEYYFQRIDGRWHLVAYQDSSL